MTENDTVSDLH